MTGIVFVFLFKLGNIQGGTPGLHSEITPRDAQKTIGDARNQTRVSCLQGKHLICCPITSAPLQKLELWFPNLILIIESSSNDTSVMNKINLTGLSSNLSSVSEARSSNSRRSSQRTQYEKANEEKVLMLNSYSPDSDL